MFIEGSEIRIAPSLQCLPHSLEVLDTSVCLVDKWLCSKSGGALGQYLS